ncbi:carbamate kinase [Aminivibrio sp.]|jgi:carbamate kinase|uniref:carbamate kinase n=1 Tax=Aminivibrio sp. TaxID=1872489 RepID=UPI001A371046|nr:carbamate kinase [Aminivibrio sp.]MBL3539640.1 carbamate kinase [Aminivibrio sp.]
MRVLVALGGNAILQRGQKGTAAEQRDNIQKTVDQIVRMIRAGHEVVVTHGNGPQVGAILIQNELGSTSVPAMPMDVCGAESQGLIGYMFCQSFRNTLALEGLSGHEPACVVTQVEVDPADPAFAHPTKPVGPFYTEEAAKKRMAETGEFWIDDAGRGWRRVVPSPDPKYIVEKDVINSLIEKGFTVIASGGGGIPVIRKADGTYQGVEAVIDKDLAGERLAAAVKADILMILTDVPRVAINYNTPNQKWLENLTVNEMETLEKEGHFKAGSMGPKVKAALRFVRNGGNRAVIASLEQALEAMEGSAGTQILKD